MNDEEMKNNEAMDSEENSGDTKELVSLLLSSFDFIKFNKLTLAGRKINMSSKIMKKIAKIYTVLGVLVSVIYPFIALKGLYLSGILKFLLGLLLCAICLVGVLLGAVGLYAIVYIMETGEVNTAMLKRICRQLGVSGSNETHGGK